MAKSATTREGKLSFFVKYHVALIASAIIFTTRKSNSSLSAIDQCTVAMYTQFCYTDVYVQATKSPKEPSPTTASPGSPSCSLHRQISSPNLEYHVCRQVCDQPMHEHVHTHTFKRISMCVPQIMPTHSLTVTQCQHTFVRYWTLCCVAYWKTNIFLYATFHNFCKECKVTGNYFDRKQAPLNYVYIRKIVFTKPENVDLRNMSHLC